MIAELIEGVTSLVFPRNCVLCRQFIHKPDTERLCPACCSSLRLNRAPFCRHCSRPLPSDSSLSVCRECLPHRYAFTHNWSAALYDPSLQRLIHLFKYGQKTGLAADLAALILRFIGTYKLDLGDYDLLVPVPLHPARMRERGYNQARLLAERLAGPLGLPVEDGVLRRGRYTDNQARLKQKERWTNIEGAFTIKHSNFFKDKSILLVDDLFTTGATLHAAAAALKASGAKFVSGLTVAIAV